MNTTIATRVNCNLCLSPRNALITVGRKYCPLWWKKTLLIDVHCGHKMTNEKLEVHDAKFITCISTSKRLRNKCQIDTCSFCRLALIRLHFLHSLFETSLQRLWQQAQQLSQRTTFSSSHGNITSLEEQSSQTKPCPWHSWKLFYFNMTEV